MKEYIKKLLSFNKSWEELTNKKDKCYFVKSLVAKAQSRIEKEYFYEFSNDGFKTYFEMLRLMFSMQSAGKLRRDFTFSLSGRVFGVKMWNDAKKKKLGFTDNELNIERDYDAVIDNYFQEIGYLEEQQEQM